MATAVLDPKNGASEEELLHKQRLDYLNQHLKMSGGQQTDAARRMYDTPSENEDDGDDEQEGQGQQQQRPGESLKEKYDRFKESQKAKEKAEAEKKIAQEQAEKKGVEKGVEHQLERQGARTIATEGAAAGTEAVGAAAAGGTAAAGGAAAAGGVAAGGAAATGTVGAAVAVESNPVGWTITGIAAIVIAVIVAIIVIVFLFLFFVFAACETPGLRTLMGRACPKPAQNQAYSPNRPGLQDEGFVNISAINVVGGPIPTEGIDAANQPARVKQTIADKLAVLWRLSHTPPYNLDWVVTSAWRSGNSTSCHSLGEAVDIGLRPQPSPAVDASGQQLRNNAGRPLYNDPRINTLIQLGRQAGFAFILDEYNYPTGRATGGHVHMSIGGYLYCVDNDA
jgi:hypothetical protein